MVPPHVRRPGGDTPSAQQSQYLRRRPPPRADRALHIAVPHIRGLRARPVDTTAGLGEGMTVLGPDARAEARTARALDARLNEAVTALRYGTIGINGCIAWGI